MPHESTRRVYCSQCGNPDCPTVSTTPTWDRCPATPAKSEFSRQCHVGATALRVAAERLELLSRNPERLHTTDAGLAIDAMASASHSCQALVAVLLDADIERRTA